jgi:glucose-6-phosphate dehydrogenase assembly protein OpcA
MPHIVVISEDRGAPEARLDGQLRVGGDAGAVEVVLLRAFALPSIA